MRNLQLFELFFFLLLLFLSDIPSVPGHMLVSSGPSVLVLVLL